MFIKLFLLFTLVPLVELYVLIKIGSLIGAGTTIALIFLTGFAGAYLARTQGFDLLQRIQNELSAGRLPTSELLDGAMVLVGGVLLLTPGFCTDILGFMFLIPLSRHWIKGWLQLWFKHLAEKGTMRIYHP